jgi:hypothetical protein
VESNDPQGPKNVVLFWQGRAEPVFEAPLIDVFRVPADKPYERVVKLTYPGGPRALSPELESVDCQSAQVKVTVLRNRPDAVYYGSANSGRFSLGNLELLLQIAPPSAGGHFRTICHLTFRYGDQHIRRQLPISIHFLGGEVTPEVEGITLTAGDSASMVGQERVVRILERSSSGELEVTGSPPWLGCRVDSGEERTSHVRLKLLRAPDTLFVSETVQVGRKGEPQTRTPIKVHVYTP